MNTTPFYVLVIAVTWSHTHGLIKFPSPSIIIDAITRGINGQASQTVERTACEGAWIDLSCNTPNTLITILGAKYGRSDDKTCISEHMGNKDCTSTKSLSVMKVNCNTKKSCAVRADNQNFGDPCFGTTKYLTVSYECLPASHFDLKLPEGKSATLSCDTSIVVMTATYGGVDRKTCNPRSEDNERSLNVMKMKCDGKEICHVKANNKLFGDPCFGTHKDLLATYTCLREPVIPLSLKVPEKRQASLSCGTSIVVLSAIFGRLEKSCYPKSEDNKNSLRIMKLQCDGKEICHVEANNKQFGDPCFGTRKYLTVTYTCLPDPATAADQIDKVESKNDYNKASDIIAQINDLTGKVNDLAEKYKEWRNDDKLDG